MIRHAVILVAVAVYASAAQYDFYQPQVQHVTIHDVRILPGVPMFGKLRAVFFQTLETSGAMASNAWN